MNLNFLFFNTFLNLSYKNILFYRKIYLFGFDFCFKNFSKFCNFFIFFFFWSKKYCNFNKNKFLYKFLLNKNFFYFLFINDFNYIKINFIYFIILKKIYIFFLNLIINLYYLFYFFKKKIYFYKKIFINFSNNFCLFFKKKYILSISYFYNKIYLTNIYLLFKSFLNIFSFNLLKIKFIFNSFKKIFYIYFNKKIFKRFLFIVLYNLFIIYIPKYIIYLLNINKLLSYNNIVNIFSYFKLLFGVSFFICDFFLNNNFIIDFIFYKKYLFILNNKYFSKSSFGYFLTNNILYFENYNFLNFFFKKNIFYLKFILYDLFLSYNFYILCDNNYIINNLNYFSFNKNLEYLICILKKISNTFSNSYILDKIIDFPIKNFIYININKIFDLVNLTIFQISNILNILNFDFIYYKYYYLIYIPFYRCDILIDEDLIDEIYRFFKLNFLKKIFYNNNLKIFNNLKYLFIYNIKKIFLYKNIKEISSSSFIENFIYIKFFSNKNPIKILNPVSNKASFMRFNLFFGLINNFFSNFNQLKYFYIYEFGNIYYYNTTFYNKNFIRSFYEKKKISLFYWNIDLNIFDLESFISLFSDLFFFLKIDYLINFKLYNKIYNEIYFFCVLNDRVLGSIFRLNLDFNNKINDPFILDLNFLKKKRKKVKNFFKKKFFIRDLNIIYNFKYCFQNFIYLIKKFFLKFNLNNILYNICYVNNYKFYKFICIRIIFFTDLYLNFNYINYLLFKIINFFNINSVL